jgi:hypothetical protein
MQGFVVLLMVGAVIWWLYRLGKKAEQQALQKKLEQAARERVGLPAAGTTARTSQLGPAGARQEQGMTPTGTHKGHAYSITYATESDWPVTSVRLTMRHALPMGVAVHPRGAAPWSAGRIGSRTITTGDAAFDKRFAVRAERPGDLRFLAPEVRGAMCAAIDAHPGLWVGHDGLVCVERGHLRDGGRIGALLDELVTLALLLMAAVDAAPGAAKARREPTPPAREAQSAAAASFEVAAPASSAEPGDIQLFIKACFDRRVASYEVNRRLKNEWSGRRVHGVGTVVRRFALGGHDFDFAGLKGFRVELHVAGPDEVAKHVRVQMQTEPDQQTLMEALGPGQKVRFDGQFLSSNPLLMTLQLVGATVTPAA